MTDSVAPFSDKHHTILLHTNIIMHVAMIYSCLQHYIWSKCDWFCGSTLWQIVSSTYTTCCCSPVVATARTQPCIRYIVYLKFQLDMCWSPALSVLFSQQHNTITCCKSPIYALTYIRSGVQMLTMPILVYIHFCIYAARPTLRLAMLLDKQSLITTLWW